MRKYTHKNINSGYLARELGRIEHSSTPRVFAVLLSNGEEVPIRYPEDVSGLLMEYSEWEDVPVDTPIWVYDAEDGAGWIPRHFACYKDGFVRTWPLGKTSHTVAHGEHLMVWETASLTKPENLDE